MSINLEDHLDADHLAVLEMLPGDLLDLSDLPAARARLDEFIAHMPAPEMPDSVEVADHHVEAADGHQVLVRVYRPKQRRDRSPGLYWIHGGGMTLGDVGMDEAGCAAIASNLNVVVASVDYRLAPEFPYPTPLEDCYCGLTWFFDRADEFGLDTARIAVGGASAGGGLAAGLALLARDRKQVSPCFQLLTFPMIDDRNETPSSSMIDDNRLWNRDANIVGWSAYLDGDNGADDVPVLRRSVPGDRPRRASAGHHHRRQPRHLPRRGHRLRPGAARGRGAVRAARVPGRVPRLVELRPPLGHLPALAPRRDGSPRPSIERPLAQPTV